MVATVVEGTGLPARSGNPREGPGLAGAAVDSMALVTVNVTGRMSEIAATTMTSGHPGSSVPRTEGEGLGRVSCFG